MKQSKYRHLRLAVTVTVAALSAQADGAALVKADLGHTLPSTEEQSFLPFEVEIGKNAMHIYHVAFAQLQTTGAISKQTHDCAEAFYNDYSEASAEGKKDAFFEAIKSDVLLSETAKENLKTFVERSIDYYCDFMSFLTLLIMHNGIDSNTSLHRDISRDFESKNSPDACSALLQLFPGNTIHQISEHYLKALRESTAEWPLCPTRDTDTTTDRTTGFNNLPYIEHPLSATSPVTDKLIEKCH